MLCAVFMLSTNVSSHFDGVIELWIIWMKSKFRNKIKTK